MFSRAFVAVQFLVLALGQDELNFEPFREKNHKVVDIYTNHHDFKEVLKSYTQLNGHQSIPRVIRRNDLRGSRYYGPQEGDILQSDFGVFTDPKPEDEFVYVQTKKHKPVLKRNETRIPFQRPNFLTSKPKNKTASFSYVHKINLPPANNKVNDMLKNYLGKLYKKRYQGIQDPNLENLNKDGKFLEDGFWNLKNKIKNKLLSIFQVVQFDHSKCTAVSSSGDYEGTCYHQYDCLRLNGTAMGNCANGYGVCCVFKGSCGGSSNQNCSYFESPNYPNYYPGDGGVIIPTTTTTENPSPTPDPRLKYDYRGSFFRTARQSQEDSLSCVFNILKVNDSIQQFRIDFLDLELAGPTDGACIEERLVVSGQNINNQIPPICGYNTGQHIYVDVSMLNGPLSLSILSSVIYRKRFRIRICQIAETCSNSNCLQYYTGVRGVIQSFNYDQSAMFNRSYPGYQNNLNYAICIRKEAGYCSITYTNVANGIEYPFQMVNYNEDGTVLVPEGEAGSGPDNCPDDYIVIGGTRLCGDKFNDGTIDEDLTMNAPVTDSSSGPIVIPVRTNEDGTGLGFKLFYMQNRCNAM